MNQHVEETVGLAEQPVRNDVAFVQDDSDYPVDPLDDFPEINAFGSATALEAEEVRQDKD